MSLVAPCPPQALPAGQAVWLQAGILICFGRSQLPLIRKYHGPLAPTRVDNVVHLRHYLRRISHAVPAVLDVGAGTQPDLNILKIWCTLPMVFPPALAATIASANQTPVLRFWDRLDSSGQSRLLAQLEAVRWDELHALRRLALQPPTAAVATPDATTAVTPRCHLLGDPHNGTAVAEAIAAGQQALAEGRVGAILVAGGQGTRLGCRGPKGLYAVGPLSGATLFEVLLGKLQAVRRRYGKDVPLAIMTSSATDADTKSYLAATACCGLDPRHLFTFQQQDLPALDAATGNLLLDAPDRVAMAPDGHGGMLTALAASGGLEWFAARGTEHLMSFQVDNPLAMPLHPEFIGCHILARADISTQVVRKTDPGERVGVVVTIAGRTHVIEYSDLPATAAAERLSDGRLRFHAGSIAVHGFTRAFLERVAACHDALPLHLARKAVPHLDATGTVIEPKSPNAIKFERFIFDLMPLADTVCVVEIAAEEGFAPLKNPAGSAADAPEHVRAALLRQAHNLLARAGVSVREGVEVELDPASILDEQDIAAVLPHGSVIDSPQVVRQP